jgi:hypothetical protein
MPVNAVRSCRVPDIHTDVINTALARRTRDVETAGCLAKRIASISMTSLTAGPPSYDVPTKSVFMTRSCRARDATWAIKARTCK